MLILLVEVIYWAYGFWGVHTKMECVPALVG